MKVKFICLVIILFLLGMHVVQKQPALALSIKSSNVKAMAVYKLLPTGPGILKPDQVNFNITSAAVIDSMISSIEFSVDRDGSLAKARTVAYVYLKFNDDSIAVYDLFLLWNHISKIGQRANCYYISKTGSTLLKKYAQ